MLNTGGRFFQYGVEGAPIVFYEEGEKGVGGADVDVYEVMFRMAFNCVMYNVVEQFL